MDKVAKKKLVSQLNAEVKNTKCLLVVQNKGMDVEQISALRKKVREGNSSFKIVKNSLAKIALSDTDYSDASSEFVGPIGLAYSDNPVELAKSVVDFSNDCDNIDILSGYMDNKKLSSADINNLSKLPSLDELRAGIIRLAMSSASSVASVLSASQGNIVRVINSKYSN